MSDINHNDLITKLGHTLAALVKYAPAAPETRAFLRARTNTEPPGDVLTYEQLAAWVMENVRPAVFLGTSPTTAQPNTHRPDRALTVEMEWTGEETGSTHYSRHIYGTSRVHFTTQDLIDIASQHDNFDDFLDAVVDAAREDATDDDVEYKDCGDTDYDDSDGDFDWEESELASRADVKNSLRDLVTTIPDLNHLSE